MGFFQRWRIAKEWREEDHPRDEDGRFTESGSAGGDGGDISHDDLRDPSGPIFINGREFKPNKDGKYDVGDDIDAAIQLIAKEKDVILDQPREIATLLEKMEKYVSDMVMRGEKATVLDICRVSVPGTNLFCAENKGIPRVQMPQLKGVPIPGSPADKLPRDVRGEVDVSKQFREHLEQQGFEVTDTSEGAAFLRATQRDMNGGKIAGIAKAYMNGTLADERIFVDRAGYIIDGHHRWGAQVAVSYASNTYVPVKVARIDADIGTLITMAKDFAKTMGIPQADVSKAVRLPCAGGACGR